MLFGLFYSKKELDKKLSNLYTEMTLNEEYIDEVAKAVEALSKPKQTKKKAAPKKKEETKEVRRKTERAIENAITREVDKGWTLVYTKKVKGEWMAKFKK